MELAPGEPEKMEESKEASTLAIKHQTEELENVQEKIRNVRKELDLAEGRPQANNDLEKFMTRQIEELEEELVCPVCLEVTTKAPIYKCSDDHLICRYCYTFVCLFASTVMFPPYAMHIDSNSRECRPNLKMCPQCREDYPKEWKR